MPHQIQGYYQTINLYENGHYNIIEGEIENFDPMPFEGHKNESFSVNNVSFYYSDYDESYYGFNQTSSHGGPIQQNAQYVRIAYAEIDKKNVILKLEIRK